MLGKLISKIKSIVSTLIRPSFDIKYDDVSFDWDTYDEREIQKTTNEIRNILVDIPYFFSYNNDEYDEEE